MSKRHTFIFTIFFFSMATMAWADLSLSQVLEQAEATSPDLRAALSRAESAHQSIAIAKAAFMPTMAFEAIDSFGFPGSSRDLNVSGLMGSPYRSGPGAGLVADLTLVDFSRQDSLNAARQTVVAAESQVQVVRYQVDQAALQIFMDASRYRGDEEAAAGVVTQAGDVEREVNRFVRTGQRSVVEKLLVEDQTSTARMDQEAFQKQYEIALQRLGLALGSQAALSCPTPLQLSEPLDSTATLKANPMVARAAAEAMAAKANAQATQNLQMPKLFATASAGEDSEARLVNKREYSGGFGVTFPLFEGYRLTSLAKQARAEASAKNEDLLGLQLEVLDLNARYDEIIGGARVKLKYLTQELEQSQRAIRLAKERYSAFSGSLVDVREAIRNLERVEAQQIDVRAELILALGSKALLNGQTLK